MDVSGKFYSGGFEIDSAASVGVGGSVVTNGKGIVLKDGNLKAASADILVSGTTISEKLKEVSTSVQKSITPVPL